MGIFREMPDVAVKLLHDILWDEDDPIEWLIKHSDLTVEVPQAKIDNEKDPYTYMIDGTELMEKAMAQGMVIYQWCEDHEFTHFFLAKDDDEMIDKLCQVS